MSGKTVRQAEAKTGAVLLAEFLQTQGETAASFARRMEITESYVSHLLAGRRAPSLELAVALKREARIPVESWRLTA